MVPSDKWMSFNFAHQYVRSCRMQSEDQYLKEKVDGLDCNVKSSILDAIHGELLPNRFSHSCWEYTALSTPIDSNEVLYVLTSIPVLAERV